jgi:hypothetical protein
VFFLYFVRPGGEEGRGESRITRITTCGVEGEDVRAPTPKAPSIQTPNPS